MTKDELLLKLADAAASNGFAADSLRDLASATGTSARMLMYYFESRERLLNEIAAEILRRFGVLLAEHTQEPGVEAAEVRLTRLWHSLSARRNEALIRTLIQLMGTAVSGREGLKGALAGQPVDLLRTAVAGVLGNARSASALTTVMWGGLLVLIASGDREGANQSVLRAIEAFATT